MYYRIYAYFLPLFLCCCGALAAQELPLLPMTPDGLKLVSPSGQPAADASLADHAGAPALRFVCNNTNPWPGVMVKPAAGIWDLSAYGYIEATIHNPGSKPLVISLRVDDAAGLISQPWNLSYAKAAPGQSITLRVYLDHGNNGTSYPLMPSKIAQVIVNTGKNEQPTPLVLQRLVAGGQAGDAPKDFVLYLAPDKDIVFAPAYADSYALKEDQVRTSSSADGLLVSATAATGGTLTVAPAKGGWKFTNFTAVDFELENPTGSPVEATCRISYPAWLKPAGPETKQTIPAGGKATVRLNWLSDLVWDGTTKSGDALKTTDAASEKVVGTGTSEGEKFLNDTIHSVGITLAGKPDAALLIKKIAGVKPAPAVLPEWSGKRPPVAGNWRVTLDESFDKPELNTAIWTPRMSYVAYQAKEVQAYSEKNVIVRDGHMDLLSEKRTTCLYDDPKLGLPLRQYASGAVTSYGKWTQRYGYFEARMQIPNTPGLWPAFWMMPDRGPSVAIKQERTTTRSGGMELDIMEHLSRLGAYRFNIACHWDDYGPEHKKIGTGRIYAAPDAEGYVTIGLLWAPGELTWYYNGKAAGHWKNDRVCSVPSYIIFCTQMAGWEGFDIDDAGLPATFKIDYVRVWQNADWETAPASAAAK